MVSVIFAAAVAAAGTAALPGAPPIFQPEGINRVNWHDDARMHRILDDLFRGCPALQNYFPQIVSSSIQIMGVGGTNGYAPKFLVQEGWHRMVVLDILIKIGGPTSDFPKPPHGLPLSVEFLMGGGNAPGIYIADDRSVFDAACGASNVRTIPTPAIPAINLPADTDYFVPVPDLMIVDQLLTP